MAASIESSFEIALITSILLSLSLCSRRPCSVKIVTKGFRSNNKRTKFPTLFLSKADDFVFVKKISGNPRKLSTKPCENVPLVRVSPLNEETASKYQSLMAMRIQFR